AEECRGRRGGDTMLARPRFGDQTALAHAAGEECLADGVVDLVGARVIQVLALQIDARSTGFLCQAVGKVEERWPTDVFFQVAVELLLEEPIVPNLLICGLELFEGIHERLGDVAAPIWPEAAAPVRDGSGREVRGGCGHRQPRNE